MNINWELKSALVKRFGTQVEAARQLKIRESRLSYIIRGHAEPTELEQKTMEDVLGLDVFRRAIKTRKGGGKCD